MERYGNLGYIGIIKQSDVDTVLTPTKFVPFWEESLSTDLQINASQPAYGSRFDTFQALPNNRTHKGDATVMAEPNTAAMLFDMLLTKSGTTGSDPYTHVFGLSNTINPNPYVWDISTGNVVKRYWGVQASRIEPTFENGEMRLKLSVSALGSFISRTISAVSGSGPYTVTLDGTYDTNPTKGLVVGDLIRFNDVSEATSIDAVVATVEDGVSFTTATALTDIAEGDSVQLRPATPSFNLLTPFLWPKTEYRFADTAANALTAEQTRLEADSLWAIYQEFESDDGSARSGGFDPASLVRTGGGFEFAKKQYFDTPEEVEASQNLTKTAVVARHFAGAQNEYELRITMHHMKVGGKPAASVSAGSVNYSEVTYVPQYDQTDGKGMTVTVINATATV